MLRSLVLVFALGCAGFLTSACGKNMTAPSATTPPPSTPTDGPAPATGPLDGTVPIDIPIPGTSNTFTWWVMAINPKLGSTFVDSATEANVKWACSAPAMVGSVYITLTFADSPGDQGFGALISGGVSASNGGVCNGYPYGQRGMIHSNRAIHLLRAKIWLNKLAVSGDPDGTLDVPWNLTPQ